MPILKERKYFSLSKSLVACHEFIVITVYKIDHETSSSFKHWFWKWSSHGNAQLRALVHAALYLARFLVLAKPDN